MLGSSGRLLSLEADGFFVIQNHVLSLDVGIVFGELNYRMEALLDVFFMKINPVGQELFCVSDFYRTLRG